MGIAGLGIAMVYLLAIAAGFIGTLLILVWSFGEAAEGSTRIGRETAERSPDTDRFGAGVAPRASVGPERPEDEAA